MYLMLALLFSKTHTLGPLSFLSSYKTNLMAHFNLRSGYNNVNELSRMLHWENHDIYLGLSPPDPNRLKRNMDTDV